MDRRELLDRAAHSPEERLLLSRVWDKCEQCRTRNIPTATGFLSPAEQAAAQGFLVPLRHAARTAAISVPSGSAIHSGRNSSRFRSAPS